jgi:hypothetical protein
LVMASGDGPQRPPRRDELSAVPGEDVDTWARRVRAKAVVDPVLLDEERARQNKARSQFTKRSQQRVRDTVRWLIASLLALVLFVILNQAAGLSGWLIAASVVAVIASAGAVARASQLRRSGDPAAITSGPALDRNQIVRLTELDDPCQLLLKRARQAIAESHSSLDSLGNQVDCDKADDMLRTGEWDLALVLRQVTRLRAKYDADPATRPDDARRALETAHDRATTLVSGLEKLAAKLKDTSITSKRYLATDSVSRLNDDALTLTAMTETVADPVIERIREFTENVTQIQQHIEGKMAE